jgi:transcriptional regulator with XRE-family HTH domain
VLPLSLIGSQIASRRKTARMSQSELARAAKVSRATLDALENGRVGEVGYTKITKLLTALGLELKLQETGSRRPTLDELLNEERNDQGLDRRR